MKKIIIMSLFIIHSFSSFAECGSIYKEKIKNLEGRMNTPRGAIMAQSTAAIITSTVIYATAGTLTLAGTIGVPAAVIGAATYYSILNAKKNSYRKAMHVIGDAHHGSGPVLEKFLTHLQRNDKEEIDRNEVIHYLTQGDFDNQFCILNAEKDTYKLASYRDLIRNVKAQLTNK